ncbi:MAG: 3-hydroxyacyl-ACP dehydratase FabZ [Litorimonas sp.]
MTPSLPLDKAAIQELLPHAPPALLVDRVLSYDGTRVHAQVDVSPEWDVFRGHFPNRPILPGVLMVEMVAQTGALIGIFGELVARDSFLAFTGINKARFRRPVIPGETLDLHAELVSVKRNIYTFKGAAECEGAKALSIDFLASPLSFDG